MASALYTLLLVCVSQVFVCNAATTVTKLTDTKFFGVLELTARDNELWAAAGYTGNGDPDGWWLIRWTGSKWENMTSELPDGVKYMFGLGVGKDSTLFINQVVFDGKGPGGDNSYFIHKRDATTGKWTQVDQGGWRVNAISQSKYLVTENDAKNSLREVVNGVSTNLPQTPRVCKGKYDNDGVIWCTELPATNDGTLFKLNVAAQTWQIPEAAKTLPRAGGEQAVITVYDPNRMAAYVYTSNTWTNSRLYTFNGKTWSEVIDLQAKPKCDQLAIDSKSVFCRESRTNDLYRIDV